VEYVLVALWVVYLAPFTLAAGRDHPRTRSILALNLTLGWTGVGWLAALAWAWPRDHRPPRLRLVSAPVEGRRAALPRSGRSWLTWPTAALAAALLGTSPSAWPRAPWWSEPQGGGAAHFERVGPDGASLRRGAGERHESVGTVPSACDVWVVEHRDGWKRVWKTASCLARAPGPAEGWIPASSAWPR